MPTRQYIFTAEEVGAILQQHLGVAGKRRAVPMLYNNPITINGEDGPRMGFSTLWMGVRMTIEDDPIPADTNGQLRKLVG